MLMKATCFFLLSYSVKEFHFCIDVCFALMCVLITEMFVSFQRNLVCC